MRSYRKLLIAAFVAAVAVGGAVGIGAQTPAAKPDMPKMDMQMDMAKMQKDPHHQLMMAYMKNMAGFARMLRDQALTPNGPDVDLARTSVAELRHDLDMMEALHTKKMASMSPEMKLKMKMMMEKMEKDLAMVKEHVIALETAVRADRPDGKDVAMHANDLVNHFEMMNKMKSMKPAGKKPMQM